MQDHQKSTVFIHEYSIPISITKSDHQKNTPIESITFTYKNGIKNDLKIKLSRKYPEMNISTDIFKLNLYNLDTDEFLECQNLHDLPIWIKQLIKAIKIYMTEKRNLFLDTHYDTFTDLLKNVIIYNQLFFDAFQMIIQHAHIDVKLLTGLAVKNIDDPNISEEIEKKTLHLLFLKGACPTYIESHSTLLNVQHKETAIFLLDELHKINGIKFDKYTLTLALVCALVYGKTEQVQLFLDYGALFEYDFNTMLETTKIHTKRLLIPNISKNNNAHQKIFETSQYGNILYTYARVGVDLETFVIIWNKFFESQEETHDEKKNDIAKLCIYFACKSGSISIIQYLLETINVPLNKIQEPLNKIREQVMKEYKDYFCFDSEYEISCSIKLFNPTYYDYIEHQTEKHLIKEVIKANNGIHLFIVAINYGYTDTIRYLLDNYPVSNDYVLKYLEFLEHFKSLAAQISKNLPTYPNEIVELLTIKIEQLQNKRPKQINASEKQALLDKQCKMKEKEIVKNKVVPLSESKKKVKCSIM